MTSSARYVPILLGVVLATLEYVSEGPKKRSYDIGYALLLFRGIGLAVALCITLVALARYLL